MVRDELKELRVWVEVVGPEFLGFGMILTRREEGHGSHEHILGLLEPQSFQCFMEVNDQLQKLVLEPYCERW